MPQLGPAEILVVLVIALMVFGPKRLPEVGRQVGRGLRELKKIQDTVRDEINDVIHAPDPAPTLPAVTTYRTSGTNGSTPPPAVTGRPAPSRYRPAIGSGSVAAVAASPGPASPGPASPRPKSPRPAGSSPTGSHAPSRFRPPGA